MSNQPLDDEFLAALQTEHAQHEVYDSAFSVGGSFGVRVSKTGRKAFFVIYPVNGRRKRMTLGNFPVITAKAARERALSIIRRSNAGEDPAAEWRKYRTRESFSEIAVLFRKEHLSTSRSVTTSREYERIIDKELLPLFGDRKLRDITAQEIGRLIHHLSEQRGAPVLAARVRAVASSIFTFAKRRGILESNPCRDTKVPKPREVRERVLKVSELHELFRALENESSETAAVLTILILTGQRIRTVLSMRWADLRIDSWHVPRRANHALAVPLPLMPAALHRLKALRDSGKRGEFVFEGGGVSDSKPMARAIYRINEEIGGKERWNALDLYRTFHAGLSGLGVRPDVIDLIQQRHSTFRRWRYGGPNHDYSDEVSTALRKWAKLVVPPITGTTKKVVPLFGS